MPLSLPQTPPVEKGEKASRDKDQKGNQTSSPDPSNNSNSNSSHDIPDGFQQLIDHNNNNNSNKETTPSYPPPPEQPQPQRPNMYSHNSNPASDYSSPAPQYPQAEMAGYDQNVNDGSPYSYPPPPYTQGGYGIENSSYPPPPETVAVSYHQAPTYYTGRRTYVTDYEEPDYYHQTPHHSYSTPATSPPTPSQQSDAMRTRSGKAIRTTQAASGSRSYRAEPYTKPSPKPRAKTTTLSAAAANKKKKADKAEEPEFVMESPLSVVCAEMANVHEIDIDAYAKRSLEARRAEVVRSKDGKTKRPSNAFMLYRKAYQNRAKELKKHDNHQLVSKVCGASWKCEDPRVKAYFTDLARIESELHREAFPEYKFSPAKARNRKGGAAGSTASPRLHRASPDADDSELELADFDYGPGSHPPSRTASRGARYDLHHPDAEYVPPGGSRGYSDPYAQQHHHHHHQPSPLMQQQQQQRMISTYQSPPPSHHVSSYEYSNPGRLKPQPYGTLAGGGGGGGGGGSTYLQKTAEMQQQQQPMYPPPYGSNQHGGMAAMPYGTPVPGMPGHVENIYIHRTDSPLSTISPAAYASAGESPVMAQHGGGQFGGGMMNTMYGPPLHNHHQQHHQQQQQQQHGLVHPQLQQQQHHHNIDPSLMGPLHPQQHQDEVGSVASGDPYDGPLGIYNTDGGGGEFSLGGYGGAPDPIYQPTPPPVQHVGLPPYQPHHTNHQQPQQQQQHDQGLVGIEGGEDDLWKIEPTNLDDPFDFDLLDQRSPNAEGEGEAQGEGTGDGAGTVGADDGPPN